MSNSSFHRIKKCVLCAWKHDCILMTYSSINRHLALFYPLATVVNFALK